MLLTTDVADIRHKLYNKIFQVFIELTVFGKLYRLVLKVPC